MTGETFAILMLALVVGAALFPLAVADLGGRVLGLFAGVRRDRRSPQAQRGGYWAAERDLRHLIGFQPRPAVRPSPGHRNFGVPPHPLTELNPFMERPVTGVARHILGDH